jgi:hypothetical protein
MVLFKIYYVQSGQTITDKEQTFFTEVQEAAYSAYAATTTGMTGDEWNLNSLLYTHKAEAEKYFNKTIATPSVVVQYRASDKEQFKAAYLKGVGKPAAWTAKFKQIFELVPIEVRQREGGDNPDGTNKEADGKGTSSGKGGNGWLPFGSRECNVLDDLLADLGLEETLKKLFFGAGAVYLGSRALQSGNKTGQAVQGGGAAYLAYLALTATPSCGTSKKKA